MLATLILTSEEKQITKPLSESIPRHRGTHIPPRTVCECVNLTLKTLRPPDVNISGQWVDAGFKNVSSSVVRDPLSAALTH